MLDAWFWVSNLCCFVHHSLLSYTNFFCGCAHTASSIAFHVHRALHCKSQHIPFATNAHHYNIIWTLGQAASPTKYLLSLPASATDLAPSTTSAQAVQWQLSSPFTAGQRAKLCTTALHTSFEVSRTSRLENQYIGHLAQVTLGGGGWVKWSLEFLVAK